MMTKSAKAPGVDEPCVTSVNLAPGVWTLEIANHKDDGVRIRVTPGATRPKTSRGRISQVETTEKKTTRQTGTTDGRRHKSFSTNDLTAVGQLDEESFNSGEENEDTTSALFWNTEVSRQSLTGPLDDRAAVRAATVSSSKTGSSRSDPEEGTRKNKKKVKKKGTAKSLASTTSHATNSPIAGSSSQEQNQLEQKVHALSVLDETDTSNGKKRVVPRGMSSTVRPRWKLWNLRNKELARAKYIDDGSD